jgi:hypothetical protein
MVRLELREPIVSVDPAYRVAQGTAFELIRKFKGLVPPLPQDLVNVGKEYTDLITLFQSSFNE